MARPGLVHMLKYRKMPRYNVLRANVCGYDAISIFGNPEYLWSTTLGMRMSIVKRGIASYSIIEMARHQTEYMNGPIDRRVYLFVDGAVIKSYKRDDISDVRMTADQYLEEINRIYREMLNFCSNG